MRIWWFISAFFCALATLVCLSSATSGILVARRRGRWQAAQATVIRHGSRLVNTGPGAGYYPAKAHYSVASYADLQGAEHTLEVTSRATSSSVPILFDPRRPAHACADQDFEPGLFLVFAVIAAITGLALYLLPAG